MKINETHTTKVCIVGLGPAGIGSALTFLDSNLASDILCIDAGNLFNDRSCSVLQGKSCDKEKHCQIVSGLGGCSLFGGKLSLFPAGSGFVDILCSRKLAQREIQDALKLLSRCLSLEDPKLSENTTKRAEQFWEQLGFKYKYYNLYLYDQIELRKAFHNILLDLKSTGAKLLERTSLIDIKSKERGFIILAKHASGEDIIIHARYLVLGIGRAGTSLLRSLNSKLNLNGKENHLEVGIRIEFPTKLYPDIDKYHKDLKLFFDDARTYCLCKNGKIALYNLEGMCFTEGYYNPKISSGLTNIGILLRLKPSPQNEKIVYEIKKRVLKVTRGKPGVQRLTEYLGINTDTNKISTSFNASISYWEKVDINELFPSPLSEKIKNAIYYFVSIILPKDHWGDVIVFAPEVHYTGLSFPMNPDFSIIPGMYLIGECTGKFRGVLQAFASGRICAKSIIGEENGKKIR